MNPLFLCPLLNLSKLSFWALIFLLSANSFAQERAKVQDPEPKTIAVQKVISDQKIEKRLSDILAAVGSYEQVNVKVVSGVVILSGLVAKEQQIEWVQNLATRLDGVVAVQNKINSRPKDILDIAPAQEEIVGFNVAFMRHLPTIVLAISVFAVSLLLFFLASYGFRRVFSTKITSPLLLKTTAKLLALPIFFLGLYLALKISGLAGLAYTVLGGTGLLGLVLGFGLRNTFEDYTASILLSIRKPFRPNDWVRIGEYEGIIQKVTSRSTLMIDFSGNHILMPNSIVYKSVIINMTANPKMSSSFVIGLDYDDSIEKAQAIIIDLLGKSPLILKDPEPWVLVDKLGTSAVDIRVTFWLNVREVSLPKVKSHLFLEVKNQLMAEGYHFPDPEREIVFTNELPSSSVASYKKSREPKAILNKSPAIEDVRSETPELCRQSRDSDLPDQGENVI